MGEREQPRVLEPKGAGGLLTGVRVIDLTNVLAGPFCGYQLALQGADVIKVETPEGGDLARQLGADPALNAKLMGASFLAQNAGKRSVTIDLKTESGRSVFLQLIDTADVLLENFRPGVMERLSLGYGTLRGRRPGLVYCAISGFGQDSPLRDNPAYDQIVQGLAGVMAVTGDAETGPMRVGYPVCDTVAGLTAAFAIAAALYQRKVTGVGRQLDVSMFDATLVTLGWPLSNWMIAGVEPKRMGNQNATASPSGTFRTREGMLNIAANKQSQYETLCRELGVPELILDPRFAQREARKQNRELLQELLEAALAAHTAETWEARLNRAGVPAGRVLSVPDALAHPQIAHRRLTTLFPDTPDVERPVAVMGAGFLVDGSSARVASPPPRLGQHTCEVLGELGLGNGDIDRLRSDGAI